LADVLWENVGKTHKALQMGKLLAFAATAALCLFWTVVVAFAASLSSIEGLKSIDFIGDLIDKFPWLEPVLAQIAPFIVVIVQALLTVFLKLFCSFEGHVSGATAETSLFTKLAWFMIIQNFFVIALSGGLVSAYSDLIENPTSAVGLLADSLSSQSTFFIQILLVNVFIGLGIELLRVAPVAVAWIRGMIGPNLTEKEKNTTWMGLSPLSDPIAFEHASIHAWNILYFMVLFVYAPIAPITSFFVGLCFILMEIGYRHQLIYVYPVRPDSGGKIFASFLHLILTCIIVAQVVLIGLLGIKESPVASALIIPLIVITIMFTIYVKQKHWAITDNLPGRICLKVDMENEEQGGLETDFLRGAYTQPDLKAKKEALPDNNDTTPKSSVEAGNKSENANVADETTSVRDDAMYPASIDI
jgi:hypothetical protein